MARKIYVCGIINLTPDSFFEGSRAMGLEAAERAEKLVKEGADILDIGAVSTAPGSSPVSEDEEMKRLKAALPEMIGRVSVPLSVDTQSPKAAEYALRSGVKIINFTGDFNRETALLLSPYDCKIIIMHTGGGTSDEEISYGGSVIDAVNSFFKSKLILAESAGIDPSRLIIDPGIGFGKTREDDLTIISRFSEIACGDCLKMAALSRKRVTGLCGDTLTGTIVLNQMCIRGGADILRVHDVSQAAAQVKMTEIAERFDKYGQDNR